MILSDSGNASWPAALLSRQRAAARAAGLLGPLLGDLRRHLSPPATANLRRNLTYLRLPDAGSSLDADRLVKETFRSFGLFVCEFLHGLLLSPEQLAAGWRLLGRRHLEALAETQSGWILACAHTGNWEHLGALPLLAGRRVLAPIGVQFHPLLSGVIGRVKRRRGVWSVPAARGLRGLLRGLEHGCVVFLPIDGGSFRRGVPVELLGIPVKMAGGAARLSLLSGCPILPVCTRRLGYMQQEVCIHPPLYPPIGPLRASERRAAAGRITQQLADLLGAHLKRTRGQWCIFRAVAPPRSQATPASRSSGRLSSDSLSSSAGFSSSVVRQVPARKSSTANETFPLLE